MRNNRKPGKRQQQQQQQQQLPPRQQQFHSITPPPVRNMFQTGLQFETDWLSKLTIPKTSPGKKKLCEALVTSSDWVDSPKQTGLQSESDWVDSPKETGLTVRNT